MLQAAGPAPAWQTWKEQLISAAVYMAIICAVHDLSFWASKYVVCLLVWMPRRQVGCTASSARTSMQAFGRTGPVICFGDDAASQQARGTNKYE